MNLRCSEGATFVDGTFRLELHTGLNAQLAGLCLAWKWSQLMSPASRLIGLTFAVFLAGVAFLAGPVATAQAGPLPLDPNGMGGVFQGIQVFQNKGGPVTLTVDVEYAVYAPGDFTKSFGAGSDPSGGTQYVYAYEAFNINVPPNPRSLAILTVGLQQGAQAQSIQYLPVIYGNFGLLPVNSSFGGTPPNAARWDYTGLGTTIPVGQNSQILLFTSPYNPTLLTSSVSGGGLGASNILPSPIPEPASWALLGIGSAMLLYRRLRARNIIA